MRSDLVSSFPLSSITGSLEKTRGGFLVSLQKDIFGFYKLLIDFLSQALFIKSFLYAVK